MKVLSDQLLNDDEDIGDEQQVGFFSLDFCVIMCYHINGTPSADGLLAFVLSQLN